MRKLIVTIALLASLVGASACGSSQPKAPATEPKPVAHATAPQAPQEATDRVHEIDTYCSDQIRPMIEQGAELPPSMKDSYAKNITHLMQACLQQEAAAYEGPGHLVMAGGRLVAKP